MLGSEPIDHLAEGSCERDRRPDPFTLVLRTLWRQHDSVQPGAMEVDALDFELID
jgi:hypothetical protein